MRVCLAVEVEPGNADLINIKLLQFERDTTSP